MLSKDLILIIGKKNCKACEEARDFLIENRQNKLVIYTGFSNLPLPTRQKVVAELKKELREDQVIAFPIIFVNGKVLFGFSPLELETCL